MNLFRNMSITRKLQLVIAVLVLGFSGVGATFFYQQQVSKQIEADQETLNKFAVANAQVRADVLKSQSSLREFFLENDPAALTRFGAAINAANVGTALLEKLAQSDRQEQLIYQLRDAVSSYQRAAKAASETHQRLGLDENSGLHGVMRDKIHALEVALGELQVSAKAGREERLRLQNLMLTSRRHEKDFIQREDFKDVEGMLETAERFAQTVADAGGLSAGAKEQLEELSNQYYHEFYQFIEAVQERTDLVRIVNSQQALVDPLVTSMTKVTNHALFANRTRSEAQIQGVNRIFAATLIGVGIVTIVAIALLSFGLTRSVGRLRNAVQRVTEGDTEARAKMPGGDELATLGHAFDNLLDERVATLAAVQSENEQLNDSIIELLQAVAQLSQRDLTVKVPVAEDVTGPVADSLNLLTGETAKVLQGVTRISEEVATASKTVKGQSDTVMALAENEREQVVQTSVELAAAAEAMTEISDLAQAGNRAAEDAIDRTRAALETVTNTVSGINATRDTIRETEKRIKRLGERSQEITGAVNLINNIAERTHILALNASMHAASAGEAGRGFAVVADEVQRLAENARQATEQISNLVSNIQTETQDTVATMNTAISQVVDGSRLAEQAGERMQETQDSTAALAGSVQRIAETSLVQAKVSNALRGRAREIEESTKKTSQQLQEQGVQTGKLLDYAQSLVESVRVFTLPAAEEATVPAVQEAQLKVVHG